MSGHTPGPWRVVDSTKHLSSLRIFSMSDCCVASVLTHWPKREHPQSVSDANLIAAAPDLLAALMEASTILDRLVSEIGIDPAVEPDTPAYRARQAIAKATGGDL